MKLKLCVYNYTLRCYAIVLYKDSFIVFTINRCYVIKQLLGTLHKLS